MPLSGQSCYLFGSDVLAKECGNILLDKGFKIEALITESNDIAGWANERGISVIWHRAGYENELSHKPVDFIFSITHLAMIKEEVLKLANYRAVNFHDGPLPRYAGLNAPVWALVNNESRYGISWHEMVSNIDEGGIFKQVMFDISAEETALSLNTKCFSAALESFPLLVDELLQETARVSAQDLSEKSYFGKFQRPDNFGSINFEQSSETIEQLVRALNFGGYYNPLCAPKIFTQSDYFIPVTAEIKDTETSAAAGTIIDLDDQSISVATGNGAIKFSQFKTSAGAAKSAQEIAQLYRLDKNVSLLNLDTTSSGLDGIVARVSRQEAHWINQLSTLTAAELPYHSTETQTGIISKALSGKNHRHYLSALVLLLSRLNREEYFDVALQTPELRKLGEESHGLVSNLSIVRFAVDESTNGDTLIDACDQALKNAEPKLSWFTDLVSRQPRLSQIEQLKSACPVPAAISMNGDQPVNGADVTLCLQDTACTMHFNASVISQEHIDKFASQLERLAEQFESRGTDLIKGYQILQEAETQHLLETLNQTNKDYDQSACLQDLFEAQVTKTPDQIALVYENQEVTYAQLNHCANQVANELIRRGAKPDQLIGVHVSRSIDLMVATLGVHKAGAAYVPLDPDFPSERIAYMVENADMEIVLSHTQIRQELPQTEANVLSVDQLFSLEQTSENPKTDCAPDNLAYVIYTSGSTGKPKGVMVEHRNVNNFFVGMDEVIESPGTWIATTSLSFDISVLELFWTLTRGFKVVIYREDRGQSTPTGASKYPSTPMEFGLFMWGNDDGEGKDKYRLMMEGAKYFDANGFDSVWTPERHFSAFGGPYPNPAVTSSAIAAVTENIAIRSGSIVSPLHHTARIAEDWAVVDNLSNGRVGLSFASGWQPNDFLIKPENFKNNKQVMMEQIDQVKRLWRGEKVPFTNPMGNTVEIETLPRPVQKELPVWLTTAGNPDSYKAAGAQGVNVLTHLLGQSVEELGEKVKLYRQARKDAGFDPATGKITLMLHTFVGENNDEVRELVREPMKDYLGSAMKLVIDFAWSFPAFKKPGGQDSKPEDINISNLTPEERDTILEFAFERYFETSGLFGTVDTCVDMIDRCKAIGIDEVACLLDFGVDTAKVMDSLPRLKAVRDASNSAGDNAEVSQDFSWAAQATRHNATHFQCTPSMARMLSYDPAAQAQMGKLQHMMVGGEAFPNALAKDLNRILTGRLTNMYGPTETTIWSTTQEVTDPSNIPIGRPIANTDIYILDDNLQPVPMGTPGNLYIGGDGVVRGYFKREDLTTERFINNPFKNDGSRIYWTGDLAQYREDGVIEFLGRIDHQVKIRGYRIELGEIEARLNDHENVKECVIMLREDTPGDQRLTAYVIAQGAAPDTAAVREFLRQTLPQYMLPNDVMVLPALPLTPNGKVDRKQLPAPSAETAKHEAEYEAPEDELQQIIVDVWQDTLKVDRIGVSDNFFDLGGHSLLIVRVHQLLKEKLDRPISLTDLYRFPTIKSLTEFLDGGDKEDESLKKSQDRASRRRDRMGLRRRR